MKTSKFNRLFPLGLLWTTLLALLLPGLPGAAAEPAPSLARAVRPFVESNTLAGAVMLVASKDQVLSLEAAGWSDLAARKPMKTDALFWIASQSKPMTAAAFMLLVDEGKVSLDDPAVSQRHADSGVGAGTRFFPGNRPAS